jgi:molybdopterin-guanine dinucleotide biosynthesis protein A
MSIGALLLNGGAGRRMGFAKHEVLIEGRTILDRTLEQLDRACQEVTVLGQEPVSGRRFQGDETAGAGPGAALLGFLPETDLVFVVSCDIPFFYSGVIEELRREIGNHEAAIPLLAGRPQYLCALYTRTAFAKWRTAFEGDLAKGVSMRALIATIDAKEVQLACDAIHITGVNTPLELELLTKSVKP